MLTSSIDLEAYEDVAWAWDKANTSSMTPAAGEIQQLSAAAAPGFSDLYVYTALEIDDSGEQHITVYTAGNSGNPSDSAVLYNLPARLGTYGAPEIACNETGNCLLVWAAHDSSGTGEVLGTILNGSLDNHSGALLLRFASSTTVYSPVVTSNGEDFTIGWSEDTGSETSTWAMHVYTDSSTSAAQQVWEVGNHGGGSVGLVWTGSAYLMVWINAYSAVMYRAEIDPSLNVGPVTAFPGMAEIFSSASGVDGPLNLTYDPLSHQALVIYRDLDEETTVYTAYMNALRLTATGSSPEIHLDTVDRSSGVPHADIAACADPQNGGWIVAWSRARFLAT